MALDVWLLSVVFNHTLELSEPLTRSICVHFFYVLVWREYCSSVRRQNQTMQHSAVLQSCNVCTEPLLATSCGKHARWVCPPGSAPSMNPMLILCCAEHAEYRLIRQLKKDSNLLV
jgi:hypothetical protein